MTRATRTRRMSVLLLSLCCTDADRGTGDGNLTHPLPAGVDWVDLAVDAVARDSLRALVADVQDGGRSLTVALFTGSDTADKTLATRVVATNLERPALVVDLSRVISKYIGETEKNLSRLFDEAENAGAVLLFDDADALFGKRTGLDDSHDRYANVEVAYLLQLLERHQGVIILSTNAGTDLDSTFLRRVAHLVAFEPDEL